MNHRTTYQQELYDQIKAEWRRVYGEDLSDHNIELNALAEFLLILRDYSSTEKKEASNDKGPLF